MPIRNSLELPPYKSIFDPQQLEMEAYIAKLLHNNTSPDIDVQKVLARSLVKTVLGEFRPDMFEGYEQTQPTLCRGCWGFTQDDNGNQCQICNGSGVEKP